MIYNNLPPEYLNSLNKLKEELNKEEEQNGDKKKILKLKEQILMKSIEMTSLYNLAKYNPYI
jgi:hypothetical protein